MGYLMISSNELTVRHKCTLLWGKVILRHFRRVDFIGATKTGKILNGILFEIPLIVKYTLIYQNPLHEMYSVFVDKFILDCSLD